MKNAICPISDKKINENAARVIAFIMMLAAIAYILSGSVYILYAAALDFFLRCFLKIPFSPLSFPVRKAFEYFNWAKKACDKAPKVFAARLGFFMTALSIALHFYYPLAAQISMGILAGLAFFQAVFSYCLGCVIYYRFVLPFYK